SSSCCLVSRFAFFDLQKIHRDSEGGGDCNENQRITFHKAKAWTTGFYRPSALSPFPPDVDARYDDGARHKDDCQPEKHVRLASGHRDLSIGRALGSNRYQFLVLCEPVDTVHEEVGISHVLHVGIRREV